jgi:hypothetical protein
VSWYDDTYTQRIPISVYNSAGAASGDIDVTIPKDWDEFWGSIDSAGAYVRVTAADGRTLLSYDVDDGAGGAFSVANRAGRIRIDAATLFATADTTTLIWLYYDTDGTVVADASVVVAMAAVLTGYLELGGVPSARVTLVQPPGAGNQRPARTEVKSTVADERFWFDFGAVLQRYAQLVEGHLCYEEIQAVLYTVYNSSGVAQATMVSHSETRFVEIVEGRRRRMLVGVFVDDGTDATSYTIAIVANTQIPLATSRHQITSRCGLIVRDALEPAP